MRDFGTHLLGLITTLITIGVVVWVELNWEFAIYSFTFFAIIPVGACFVGLGSASGYYIGAKILHLPTSKTLTFSILFNAASSFYLINYILNKPIGKREIFKCKGTHLESRQSDTKLS